jgi:membrane protein required for colicin V production
VTWLDWILVAIVAFSILQGLRRGALAAAGGVLGVLIAYVAASYWYASLVAAFAFIPVSPPWQATIAFAVLFLGANGLLSVAASLLLGVADAAPVSRLIGVAVGGIRGILLFSVLVTAAMASPAGDPISSDVTRSALVGYVAEAHVAAVEWLNARLPDTIRLFGGGATRF